MNKMLILISIILFFCNISYAQAWMNIQSGVNSTLQSVHFPSDSIGYIATGSSGRILKTTNSGISWSIIQTGALAWIYSIHFLNDEIGFATGYDGQILKTTNGGQTWDIGAYSQGSFSIFFSNLSTGFCVGLEGRILRTSNFGQTWNIINSGTNQTLYSVTFVNEDIGYIVGGGIILKSTNQGISWIQQTIPTTLPLYGVYFVNQNIGFAIGYQGVGLKTTNGGEDWLMMNTGTSNTLWNIFFTDNENGYIVGDGGKILKTTNSGNNWFSLSSGVPENLRSVFFINQNEGYVVGENGIILKTTQGGIPVELSSFTVNVDGNNIILNWSSSSELNNRGFEIEKSADKNIWQTIGFVKGNGTTTEINNYSFTDYLNDNNTQKLFYRLKQIDYDGNFEYSYIVEVEVGNPSDFFLSQNYPNPFNPETTIKYQLPVNGFVSLKIFNILGQEVKILVNEFQETGYYNIKFNSVGLPSGIYLYKIQAGDFISIKKMMILK